jgi:hypothetical protein
MSRIMSVPAAVMGSAEVRGTAAPAVTAATATPSVAAAAAPSMTATASAAPSMTATASAAMTRDRDTCPAKRKPDRSETCGKSQDD